MFGILNDIRSRPVSASCATMRLAHSTREGAPDEPGLQRHRCRWSHPGAARSLGQIHGPEIERLQDVTIGIDDVVGPAHRELLRDRKSTRLNSSHTSISYAF